MIRTFKLDNGLSVVAEQIEAAQSVAISVLLPFGAANDPIGFEGQASIVAEMFNKGAGSWDARQLSQHFEDLGIERSIATGVEATVFSAALLPENLAKALELIGVVLLQPSFPDQELESVVQLALQDLLALEDSPASKAMVELAKLYYPKPWGASQLGTSNGVRAVTCDSIWNFYRKHVVPNNSIIGVAGKFSWEELEQSIFHVFSQWRGSGELLPCPTPPTQNKSLHVHKDTSQSHLAMAYPSVSLDNSAYYAAQLAVNILSGGMSGRLFIEVREKRGLVYTVSASHSAARGRAAIMVHAGTTPNRAEETLRVIYNELTGLTEGLNQEELERARVDLKSRVIMRGELASARAPAIVSDLWNTGRVRSLGEIKDGISAVTLEEVSNYARSYPVHAVSLVSLGSAPIELSIIGL